MGDGAFGQNGGRDLYIAKCSACHALDGSGNSSIGRSLKLRDMRQTITNRSDEELREIILAGKGRMPPNKKLDDEKLRNLTLFLRDLAAGNPESGRAVAEARTQPLSVVNEVFRDKCAACHGRDGSGRTTIGKSLKIPDLTSVATKSRSSEELAESIEQGRGRMPGYAKKFNRVQIGQFVAYVQTLDQKASQQEPITRVESQGPLQGPVHPGCVPMPPQWPAESEPTSAAGNTAPLSGPTEGERRSTESRVVATITVKKAALTGRQIYIARCSACHSSDGSGTGTVGKSLGIVTLLSPQVQSRSNEDLAGIISGGIGKMPSYKKKLTPEQIQLLVLYVRELGKER